MEPDDCRRPQDLQHAREDTGGIPEPRAVADIRQQEATVGEDPANLAQPLNGGEPGRHPTVHEGVQHHHVRARIAQGGHALLAGLRADPDAMPPGQREVGANQVGQVLVRLQDNLWRTWPCVCDPSRQGEAAATDMGYPKRSRTAEGIDGEGEMLDILELQVFGVAQRDRRLRVAIAHHGDHVPVALQPRVLHEV